MITIISHFYNEEYLLPWWLNYHKKKFDNGILIDYDSTDNSVKICEQICPHWKIVKSRNKDFSAYEVDKEVMDYENTIDGWKITLNTTEFLIGPVDKVINNSNKNQILCPSISFFDWNPYGKLDANKFLWDQKKHGIDYELYFSLRQARSIHNIKIKYSVGRHFSSYNTEELLIFHYANCISSEPMIKRRLQIQNRIPLFDRRSGLGVQHYSGHNMLTEQDLYSKYIEFQPYLKDQSSLIDKMVNYN